MKRNFIKLDKKHITEYSGKEILILWYIHNNYISLINKCSFKLSDLIIACGYSPYHNKTNQEFIETLNKLIKKNIIETRSPIDSKNILYFNYVVTDNKSFFDNLNSFICCNSSEIQTFIHAKENKILTCKLDIVIQLYYYLKSFIYELNEFKFCYPSVSLICKNLKSSNKTIIKALKDLETLNFIYKYQFGTYENTDGKIIFVPNIYAFEHYDNIELQRQFTAKLIKFKKWL